MRKYFHLCVLALVLTFTAPSRSHALILSVFNFEANAIAVFTTANSNTFSGQIGWTPFINLGLIGLRGEFGVTLLKNGLGNRFLATNVEARVSLPLFPGIDLEAGGGMHTWSDNNGGTNPAATGLVVVAMPGIVDRFFAGYTRVFMTTAANEVRAGVGFNL